MNSEKTTLPSLRNIECWIVKTETNKINRVLPYISTNNITELNKLIYAGAKLACEKIGIPSKSTKEKSKPGWEIWLETQIKNLRKQAKMIKQRKNAGTCRDKKEKATQEKITILLEEKNQKVLTREGRLKRYRQRVNNTEKTGHSKTTKENYTNNWVEMTRKHTNNRMQEKQNDFGLTKT